MKKHLVYILFLLPIVCFSQTRKKYKRRVYANHYVDLTEKGHLQIENNFVVENDISVNNFYLTDNRIRYGLNDDLEIFSDIDFVYNTEQGYGLLPAAIGFKVNILEESKTLPDMSFLGSLQSSTLASKKFALENPLPMFTLMMHKGLSKKLAIDFGYSMQWLDQKISPSYINEATVGYQINSKTSISTGFIRFTNDNNEINYIANLAINSAINKYFSVSLEVGKYFKSLTQSHYISLGLIKEFNLNRK